ncbi:MAG: hypothetical protein K8I03_01690, partial [Ignavibacteria bacterium]|nr:hypothetical protein [Ignavibacteria bacterium]
PIRAVNPNISEALENVIVKATEKDVNYRFQSCDEFARAIEQSGFSYVSQKTVYQQPQSKIVFQPPITMPHGPEGTKKTGNKTPFYIIGGLLFLLLAAAALFYITGEENVEKNVVQTQQLKKLTEDEIKSFINNWLSNQNNKNINQYLSSYSPEFNGIKRTKSGKTTYLNYYEWSDDRRKMYENAVDLNISIGNIDIKEISPQNGTAKVEFVQYYQSAKYSDEGKKVMNLKRASDGTIKIVFEELIYATETGE